MHPPQNVGRKLKINAGVQAKGFDGIPQLPKLGIAMSKINILVNYKIKT